MIPRMFKSLKDLLDGLLAPAAAPADEEHALQLATAVLLVEVLRADLQARPEETAAVVAALRDKFGLADDEAARLTELALDTARQATDLHGFTRRLNERFDMPQKLRMVEHLWRVALADGHLADHERHLLWRVGDLLHVPSGALHLARQRVRDEGPRS
jgi:uncharacterized tellurite resistance protein B-like protein